MNLEKQISEFSDLLIKNGYDGMVRVLDRENYNQTTGKIKEALEKFKLDNSEIGFSISTYIKWKDEDNYIESNFFGRYNKDNGFAVTSLDFEGKHDGFNRTIKINITQNQDIPNITHIKSLFDPGIKLKRKSYNRRFRI